MTLRCIFRRTLAAATLSVAIGSFPVAAQQQTEVNNDIPATFTPPAKAASLTAAPAFNYIKRVEMVPMRDGTKLYTVIVIPKGATKAPIVLTRTCYNAAARAHAARTPMATGAPVPPPARPVPGQTHTDSPHMFDELGLPDEIFVTAGYVVFAVM